MFSVNQLRTKTAQTVALPLPQKRSGSLIVSWAETRRHPAHERSRTWWSTRSLSPFRETSSDAMAWVTLAPFSTEISDTLRTSLLTITSDCLNSKTCFNKTTVLSFHKVILIKFHILNYFSFSWIYIHPVNRTQQNCDFQLVWINNEHFPCLYMNAFMYVLLSPQADLFFGVFVCGQFVVFTWGHF